MTDDEATALGKRHVACKGFRPMRGMLDMQGRTWDASLLWRWSSDVDVPDLRDPATLGCVLGLVREAHGSPKIMFEGQTYASVLCVVCGSGNYYIRRDCGDGEEALYVDGVWSANVRHGVDEVSCATEAEALVAALEAAP